MSWQKVCLPLNLGGLGISNLEFMGWSLNLRWLWLKKTQSEMLPFLLHRFSLWWAAEPAPNFGPIVGYMAKELQIRLLLCLLLLTRKL